MTRPLPIEDFEKAWQSNPEHRYGYEVNRPPFIVVGVLLAGFWSYLLVSILSTGLGLALGVVGGITTGISGYLIFLLLRWRHFGRLSGVICQTELLMWRQVNESYVANWSELNFDGIGLLSLESSSNQYEQYLTIGKQKLFLFRPFVRLRHLETFMGEVLIRLEQHGGLPKKKQNFGKKRRSKG